MTFNANWLFTVRGYFKGHLLLETVHSNASSKDVEVSVWMARYKRGECDRIEVDDHEHPQQSKVIP